MKEKISLILRFCFIIGCAFLCLWIWSCAYFFMKISPIDPVYAYESAILFGASLLFWILGLSVLAVVMFYELLVRYVDQRERAYRFKQTISQVLSHKFGNFLVTQKLNLSIMENRFSQDVLNRAKRSLQEMETEFKDIMKVIEEFRPEHLEKRVVTIEEIVRDVLKDYHQRVSEVSVKLRLQNTAVFVNPHEARIFVQLIIDNAFRYTGGRVYIRSGVFHRRPYLVVVNDISRNPATYGAGMGLIIARNIASGLNISLTTASRKDRYFVISFWPRKRWFD